jgi:hypothetical protein
MDRTSSMDDSMRVARAEALGVWHLLFGLAHSLIGRQLLSESDCGHNLGKQQQ